MLLDIVPKIKSICMYFFKYKAVTSKFVMNAYDFIYAFLLSFILDKHNFMSFYPSIILSCTIIETMPMF